MSRKDYVALAAAIRAEYTAAAYQQETHDDAVIAVASKIADALYADNPRFNREKFLHAALG